MNRRDRLGAVVEGRLKALVADLPSARKGQVDALHRTRVASRRVRAALPMLEPELPPGKMKKTRRTTRQITRALGRVRELDVALQILDEIDAPRASQRIAIERLRALVQEERATMHQAMLDRLKTLKPEKLVQRLQLSNEEDAASSERGRAWRRLLAAQISRRAGGLREAIDHAGALYLEDRLHAVRVAVKKLRYALELADEAAVAKPKALIRTLKRTQDELGRMHDLDVVAAIANRARATAGLSETDLDKELEAIVRGVEAEGRSLHATYVANRARLVEVCDLASDAVARRVKGNEPGRRVAAAS